MPTWFTSVVSLIGGGAMGATITAIIWSYRNRLQPVFARVSYETITRATKSEAGFTIAVTVQHNDQIDEFTNLFLVTIDFENIGNRDWDAIQFGVSLSDGDKCVFCEAIGADRHNPIDLPAPPTPQMPKSSLDFICKPLVRNRRYKIKMFVVASADEKPGEISFSTPHPLVFRTTELIEQTRDLRLVDLLNMKFSTFLLMNFLAVASFLTVSVSIMPAFEYINHKLLLIFFGE